MSEEDAQLQVAMKLIVNGGNAKSLAFEAIEAAKKNDFVGAQQKLKKADDALVKAHHSQTDMLTKEANGEHETVTLMMVHAQDHIMNAITFRDLAGEMVDLYKRLAKKSD